MYVCADGGGLWKGTLKLNNRDTLIWEPLTDHIPTTSMGAVTINPQNSNSILAGTGSPFQTGHGVGILQSWDGGKTWDTTSLVQQMASNINCFDLVWNPQDTAIINAAKTHGLYRSFDGGKTWNLTKSGYGMAMFINKTSPNYLCAGIRNSGIYQSTDKGKTWVSANGLPSASVMNGIDLSICDGTPNIIYASITGTNGRVVGIYKSRDHGLNWSQVGGSTTQYLTCYDSNPGTICQGWYNNTIAVSPADTTKLFFGGIRVHQSSDGGNTWTLNGPSGWWMSKVHVDVHSIGYDPRNDNTVFVFCDGGIWRSKNSGSTWQSLNDSLATFQFYQFETSYENAEFVCGGAQDNGVANANTSDSLMWWHNLTGDGTYMKADPILDSVFYGYWNGLTKFERTDPVNTSSGSIYSGSLNFNLQPANGMTRFYLLTGQEIKRSDNNGSTWSTSQVVGTTSQPVTAGRVLLNPGDTNNIYVYTSAGFGKDTVWYTSDAGKNWQHYHTTVWGQYQTFITGLNIVLDPNNASTLYGVKSNYNKGQQVWKSEDRGVTWKNISNNFPPIPAMAITVTPNTITGIEEVYVATQLGVYMTFGNEYNWFKYNNNLPNVLSWNIHTSYADTTVRVGTFGRSAWKTPAPYFSSNAVILQARLGEDNFYGSQQTVSASSIDINRSGKEIILAGQTGVGLGNGFSVSKGTRFSAITYTKIE
ncbi:MAG: hypothetical protein MK105_15960 [Crocinitomicaceae bacterium]|nr:hypothetical protein [Crocinitomicaceae bacterium]